MTTEDGEGGIRRFSVAEYSRLIEIGLLAEDERIELIDGLIVYKPESTPQHEWSIGSLNELWTRPAIPGWATRCRCGLTLSTSLPEPEVALVRDRGREYYRRRPTVADLGIVVEVVDLVPHHATVVKARIYARDSIPVYWIVNLPARRVEVYTDPSGPGDDPRYATARTFSAGASVPVELDGRTVASIPVDDLLP